MKSITRIYLASIIYIVIHKNSLRDLDTSEEELFGNYYYASTDEKVLDFILSIPYFDEGLKDFIVGNLKEQSVIITTEWEDEFIDKCFLWAESTGWTKRLETILNKLLRNNEPVAVLKLPY